LYLRTAQPPRAWTSIAYRPSARNDPGVEMPETELFGPSIMHLL